MCIILFQILAAYENIFIFAVIFDYYTFIFIFIICIYIYNYIVYLMPGCWFQRFCFAPQTCADDATISQFTYHLKQKHGSWTVCEVLCVVISTNVTYKYI